MKRVSERLENASGRVILHLPKLPLSAPVWKALMLREKCSPESVSSSFTLPRFGEDHSCQEIADSIVATSDCVQSGKELNASEQYSPLCGPSLGPPSTVTAMVNRVGSSS